MRVKILSAPPRLIWLALLASLIAVALPGLLTPVPPLLDYPNHLARVWLLATRFRFTDMYEMQWNWSDTNVAIDLMAVALGSFLPVSVLGRLFVALACLTPAVGLVLLNRRVAGRWTWWQVGLPAATWTGTLTSGFINFQLSLGLALIFAALDGPVGRRSWWGAFRIRAALSLVLLVAHPFALLFYAALLGAFALGPALRPLFTPAGLGAAARGMASAAIAVVTPMVAYLLFAVIPPGAGGDAAVVFGPWTPAYKFTVLATAIGTYDLRVDIAFMAALMLLAIFALGRRQLRAHAGLLLATLALVAMTLASPAFAGGAWCVDQRFPLMALFAGLAALAPQAGLSRRTTHVLIAASLAISAGRAGYEGAIWGLRQADVRSMARALSGVPQGSAVLPLRTLPSKAAIARAPIGRYYHQGPTFWHLPTLATPWRGAFTPLLFTRNGHMNQGSKQPVMVTVPWANIAHPESAPAPMHALDGLANPDWHDSAWPAECWRSHFDYALLINADMPDARGPLRLPDGLTLVRDEGFARLYAIDRTTPRGPNPARCQIPRRGRR